MNAEQSPMHDYDLVVIGSGPAGQRAAVQAAKLSERVAIVERLPSLGGVCILTGTIPSKTFREAVLMTTNSTAFRLNQKTGHSPAMAEVLERVQEVMMAEVRVVKNQMSRNSVELLRGTGRFVSSNELEIRGMTDVRRVTAENFLIAVGTRPSAPEGVPVDGRVIMTSDEVLAMEHLPRSMAVVGGGVIGVEYATFFARLGVEVTLIDRNERPIGFIDHEIVDELVHR